jgi:hypothetical protein
MVRLSEVEADLALAKRRRKRHGSLVVHTRRGDALVGGEGDGRIRPSP